MSSPFPKLFPTLYGGSEEGHREVAIWGVCLASSCYLLGEGAGIIAGGFLLVWETSLWQCAEDKPNVRILRGAGSRTSLLADRIMHKRLGNLPPQRGDEIK